MQIPVKDVQEGQIITDASNRKVIVQEKTVMMVNDVPHSVIVNGILVLDGSSWSSHFGSPYTEVELILSDSN